MLDMDMGVPPAPELWLLAYGLDSNPELFILEEKAFLRGLLILPSHIFIGRLVPPGLAFEKVVFGPKEVKAGDDESSKFISTFPLIFELPG